VTDKLEWWLDEASLPDVVWARLHVLPDGSAEVLDVDGRTEHFASMRDAQLALSEDEYVRPQSLERSELARFGMLERELLPPSSEGDAVPSNMRRILDCADAIRELAAVNWQWPWTLLSPAEHDLFHAELRREVDVQHVLHGRPARPFLKRVDRDDVLFVMSAPVQLAVVHLTYTPTPPEHPPLPATVPYDRVWEFVDRTHREAEAG
jgi:hypothetical protein